MKIWASYQDVIKSVQMMVYWKHNHKTIPPILIDSIKETLKHATKGQIQKFYDTICEKDPSISELFKDVER